MRVYEPHQHTARIQGQPHTTCYANVELWLDDLPDAILIGGRVWARQDMEDSEGGDEPLASREGESL